MVSGLFSLSFYNDFGPIGLETSFLPSGSGSAQFAACCGQLAVGSSAAFNRRCEMT